MTNYSDPLHKALENAKIAFHKGDHAKTRHWARVAININPQIEEAWLWLAAVSSPRASIAYLEKALSINPNSQRARQGMHWAVRRVRKQAPPSAKRVEVSKPTITDTKTIVPTRSVTRKPIRFQWWIIRKAARSYWA